MPIRYAVMGGYVLQNKKSIFVCYKVCATLWGLEEGEYLAIIFPEEVKALEKGIVLLTPDPTGKYDLGELGIV